MLKFWGCLYEGLWPSKKTCCNTFRRISISGQRISICQWCFQIPVLGFNSERYDLNLIKKYFVTHILLPGDVKVANKQSKVMYMFIAMFKFLDSPRKSYEKWEKTCWAKLSKSWFPYEWFVTSRGYHRMRSGFSGFKS